MACIAVLIPCHSHRAEALPEDVPVEEVLHVRMTPALHVRYTHRMFSISLAYLQGKVLCANLNKSRQLHWSAASNTDQVGSRTVQCWQLLVGVNAYYHTGVGE